MNNRNYAVFDVTTGFRHTEYTTRRRAILALREILRDQPNMKDALKVKQRGFSIEK